MLFVLLPLFSVAQNTTNLAADLRGRSCSGGWAGVAQKG